MTLQFDAILIHFQEHLYPLPKMSLYRLATTVRRRVFHVKPDEGLVEKASLEKDAKSAIVTPYVEEEPSIKQWFLSMRPTRNGTSKYIRSIFPFTTWITRYNLTWLLGDGIAGKNELSSKSHCLEKVALLTKPFQVLLLGSSLFLRQWRMPFLPNWDPSMDYTRPSQELLCTGYSEPLKISSLG